MLLPHAVGLLSAAVSFAARAEPGAEAAEALARERVLEYLRRHLADPRLDAAAVAKACHASRRTLYRMFGDEGVAARLRRMRIEHAQAMLLAEPGFACGFDSESGFYRAFRAAADMTPGEYRRAWHAR
jgi:AraC-like DNA-binding protein